MKFTLRYFIGLALLFYSSVLSAQGPGFDVPKIEDLVKIPPSPEAQAFAKYGNTPVNLYTGTPDISIPIANLQGREISVPITLTYDASGVKVEQLATWVGLGWNLNVGGMVTRQVNGDPDDYENAYPSMKTFYDPSIASEYSFVNGFSADEGQAKPDGDLVRYFNFLNNVTRTDIVTYKYEIQPDTYSFSALGLSGTLYIDYATGNALCMDHPEIKAYPTFVVVGPIKKITAWKIVDGFGNAYYFDVAERTYTYQQSATDMFRDYSSAWMLTKVESKNKRDIVLFTYSSPIQWNQPQLAGRGEMYVDYYESGTPCGNDQPVPAPVPLYKIYQRELKSIKINDTLVALFQTSAIERKDLKARKYLASIKLLGETTTVAKRIKFVRSYFGDSTQTDEKLLRLRLDGLEIYGNSTSTVPEKYAFTYEAGDLPSRESFAQDFWGYYNGKSNATLIPRNYYYDKQNVNFAGANRDPDFTFGKIGSLIKIKYPTGGSTEFCYRQHKALNPVYVESSSVMPGYASLTGGRDDNDPYGYIACDDNTNIPPKGTGTYFYVASTQALNISLIATGDIFPGLQIQYVAVYPVASHGTHPLNPSFCEVLNGSTPMKASYYGTLTPSTLDFGQVQFEPGYYRILILNTNPKLTVTVTVTGTANTNYNNVGGQRIASIIDKDDNNVEVGSRYYYYGDLSTVSPSQVTRQFITSSDQATGSLFDLVNFEEVKSVRRFDQLNHVFYNCESLSRYSSNRTKASQHITYPVVTEVQFGALSNTTFNGYTISTFWDLLDAHTIGYYKPTILNGRVKNKTVYNNAGAKVQEEKTYYSQRLTGYQNGFEFYSTSSLMKDTYVLRQVLSSNPTTYGPEHYTLVDPITWRFSLSRCSWDGSGGPLYSIVYCRAFSSEYKKIPYSLSRYLARTDSTVVLDYSGSATFSTSVKNTYDSINHFQIVKIQTKDSRGDKRVWNNFYPHELAASNPSDPAWQALVNQNRIAEVVKVQSAYGNALLPDYTKLTKYKTISGTNGSMTVPDVIQFSSGSGTLEDRINFSFYDNYGNPVEVSKTNDSKSSYIWGLNQSVPIAEVKGASLYDIAYNSFEETGPSGGWSYGSNPNLTSAKTGAKSHNLSGSSVTRLALNSGSTYVLSFWAKGGDPTISSGVISANDASAAESDGWKYFEKTITGVTSITISGPYTPFIYIDELRIYPKGSLMTTHTYKKFIGKTSTTDIRNRTTFFEYDKTGRLWLIRDHDQNILKQFLYNFRTGEVPVGVY